MRVKAFLAFGCLAASLALPVALRADSCQTAGNRVQNCSFGTGDLTDWTLQTVGKSPKYVTSIGGGYGGDNAELFEAGSVRGGIVAIEQVLDLYPGQTYTVTFWLSSNNVGGNSSFDALWDNSPLLYLQTSSALTEYSYTVTGIYGGEGGDDLEFLADNVTQGSYNLSDISVELDEPGTATPEPTSFLLFGSGLLGLAGMVRREFGKNA
jgi:hypothetical protein